MIKYLGCLVLQGYGLELAYPFGGGGKVRGRWSRKRRGRRRKTTRSWKDRIKKKMQ